MLKFWGRVRILVEPGGILLLMAAFVVQPALANMALKTVKFESKLAKQNLEINVYLPRGYAEESTLAYPVLLTTAGGSRLPMLTTQVD